MNHRSAAPTLALLMFAAARVYALDPTVALSQYARTSWTERDGLPSSVIWAMAQDGDGYLWLGTGAGLVRFDGVRFSRWDELGRPAVPESLVRALCVSRDGSLWVGFGGGGGVSRWHNGQVSNYSSRDGAPEGAVVTLLEDREGSIWAGGHGLSRFRNNVWERMEMSRGFSPNTAVYGLYEDHATTLWVGSSSGLLRRRAGEEAFHSFASAEVIRALTEDVNGNLWVTGPEQTFGMLLQNDRRTRTIGGRRQVNGWQLIHDWRGNLWFATAGEGLWRIPAKQGAVRPTAERYLVGGLTSEVVRSLLEDREGNLWVGTQSGLNRLADNQFMRVPRGHEELLARPVRAVIGAQDGSVWVGADNGVYRFFESELQHYGRGDGLPSLVISALQCDRDGTVWAATEQGGVARFEKGRFWPVALPRDNQLKRIIALTVDVDGALWLSDLDRGVFRWKDGRLIGLDGVPEIGRKFARLAYTDRAGRVWLGLNDGSLVVYERGRFRVLLSRDGPVSGSVSEFYEDTHGTFWIGTTTGLSRFEDGRLLKLRQKDGFPISNASEIMEDNSGDLWLGVSSGFVRLSRMELDKATATPSYPVQYTFYDMSDGLSGVPAHLGSQSAARSGDGALWFVTSNGLAVVNPQAVPKSRPAPPVRIESVVADEHRLNLLSRLELPPRTSKLEIAYTALTLTASDKVRFRYRLDGFDTDGVDAGTRRQAFYTNLPQANYRFRVTVANSAPVTNSEAVWDFSIRPAFYQTAWFYLACVMIFALTLWTAWQRHLRHVRREFSLVLAERTRMGREIHDTLLQSLVGVALQFDELLSEIESSPQVAKQHIERLRSQAELYVRETRQSIWDLRSPTLERRDFATALQETAESIASSKAIRLEFTVSGVPRRSMPKVEEQLLRIGQEAVTNAVRHAHATVLRVELCYEGDMVRLRVSDDGCGFDPHDPAYRTGEHYGVAIMQERAEHIRGQFTIVSMPGQGTQVETVAPVQ